MKTGDVFSMKDNPVAKGQIDLLIAECGQSKSVNELALSIHCKDRNGTRFDLVQFHNRPHLVYVVSP